MDTIEEAINQKMKEVAKVTIQYVSEKMMECLIKHIWDDMYAYDYYPNKHYADGTGEATGDFMNAFDFTPIKEEINRISTQLVYDYMSMRLGYGEYSYRNYLGEEEVVQYGIHQTSYGKDLRKELFDLLNTTEEFGHKDRNAFWDNFIKEVDVDIVSWVTTSLLKQGVKAKVTRR